MYQCVSYPAAEPYPPSSQSLAYFSPTTNHYISPTYFSPPPPPSHLHVGSSPPRPNNAAPQRKRPKYTRSKTGCLTCRAKKIKCDETKPSCMRCTHGQRECTWPEGVPSRKKPAPKKQHSADNHPSTAGSPGISEASTPPTRHPSPPNKPEHQTLDLNLPPLVSRRHSEPYLSLHSSGDHGTHRRQSAVDVDDGHSVPQYPHNPGPHSHVLPMIPEMSPSYPQPQRFNHSYSHHMHTQPTPVQSLDTTPGPSRIPGNNSARRHDHNSHAPNPWNNPHPNILNPVDPIEPYFPTIQERNLIRHYCDASLSIIMAVPSENPVVAANVPLVFNRAPGSDPSTEALRMALLGVAAVHQSFLLGRSGVTPGGATEMMQLANLYRMKARQLLASACTTIEGTQSDASLGASLTIALIDIFTGGHHWMRNLDLAKTLVNTRGGPAVMLARNGTVSKPGCVTGASRARLMLEILAIYEIFGCLATGQPPVLLAPETSSWWHDQSNASSFVENVFGISRALVPLLARVTSLASRSLENKSQIVELGEDGLEALENDQADECSVLYGLIESWSDPSNDLPLRVHTGNNIYLSVMKIILLRDVLHQSPADPMVQECADSVLTLCLECASSKMTVDLNWPVIIAGSQTYGSERAKVLELFETFRHIAGCYEVDTSEQIVLQVWGRLDQDHPGADWRSVMRDFNLNVLVL
ncbi:hypothetical protein JAAARDRAFT_136956 [Jaapia argillacea MUCL 33604]|uniref:Zn(2)-C6 fungal-type domain-containing protein n=1 Tax=Jaapia argillacea MUCL 33604 TaxID=933084 RepID=A0A067PFC8_9AGAM|nr:hypothetical protein JAAARDRAFT_136956 [Jaapia argillacea MUCL 33604]